MSSFLAALVLSASVAAAPPAATPVPAKPAAPAAKAKAPAAAPAPAPATPKSNPYQGRAPAGGIWIDGKFYAGGQFLPVPKVTPKPITVTAPRRLSQTRHVRLRLALATSRFGGVLGRLLK